MGKCNMTIKVIITNVISARCLHAFIYCLPVAAAMALPEDVEQPTLIEYNNSEFLLDEGKEMLYGSIDKPAVVTQGTLKISGLVISIERPNGEIKKITVTGTPARYQQQPAVDQGLAVAEGNTIILDYETQQMTAVDNVTFTQDGNVWSGCQVDYYIESKRVTTPSCENGEQASLFIPPRND
jgi:lipopolysaccharide export system protein LptA